MSGLKCIASNNDGDVLRNEHKNGVVFIKLGGSLVSDKTEKESLRGDVLARISRYGSTIQNTDYGSILLYGRALPNTCAPVQWSEW